ncbi:MAG: hypothetical protein KA807_20555 [Prolixibacteraceae bacterium]|nr:hypothetical protein [Prolixibacteraceae bacterium]
MNDQRLIIADCPLNSVSDIPDPYLHARIDDFVKRLVDHIKGYTQNESLTIGLEGSWGSGKSSLLNFIEKALINDTKFVIVRFNPWCFTSTSNLISQFFKHLSIKLEKQSKFKTVSKLFKTLSAATAVVGGFVSIVNPPIGAFISASVGGLNFIGNNLDNNNDSEESVISDVKDRLEKQLLKLEQRVIVLIDDLDRLDGEEIKSMLKAIRAIGNLPNMIYIMAYDREIVTKSITTSEIDGNDYLEKIIQLVLSVPMPDEVAIFNYIRKNLENSNYLTKTNFPFFATILTYAINHINTMRKAKQFLNRFYYRMQFTYNRLCEYDVFILSILEVIKPRVVELIKIHRPITEYEAPASMRYLPNSQRIKAFIDGINELYVFGNEEKKDMNANTTVEFASPYCKTANGKLSEYRCVMHLLHLLLEIPEEFHINRAFTGDPDLTDTKFKFRIREDESFDYYFSFIDDKIITANQYLKYISMIINGEMPFKKGEYSVFMKHFVDRCCYLFDSNVDDHEAYVRLALQLTSDPQTLIIADMYNSVLWLLELVMKDNLLIEMLLKGMISKEIATLYLVYIYKFLSTPDPNYNKPRWFKDIFSKYQKQLEDQICKNAIEQYSGIDNIETSRSLAGFLLSHKEVNEFLSTYYTLLSNNAFVVALLKGSNAEYQPGQKLKTNFLTDIMEESAFKERMKELYESDYIKTQSEYLLNAISELLQKRKTPQLL